MASDMVSNMHTVECSVSSMTIACTVVGNSNIIYYDRVIDMIYGTTCICPEKFQC